MKKIVIESLVIENEENRLRKLSEIIQDFEFSKKSGIVLQEPKETILLELPDYFPIKQEDNLISYIN